MYSVAIAEGTGAAQARSARQGRGAGHCSREGSAACRILKLRVIFGRSLSMILLLCGRHFHRNTSSRHLAGCPCRIGHQPLLSAARGACAQLAAAPSRGGKLEHGCCTALGRGGEVLLRPSAMLSYPLYAFGEQQGALLLLFSSGQGLPAHGLNLPASPSARFPRTTP